jgi:iron complex outermembrane receptor protein
MPFSTNRGLFASVAAGAFVSAFVVAPQAVAQSTTAAAAEVQEVVVTARKTNERIEDVPLAITAFDTKTLADRGATGLADIASLTPGFVFQTYASSFNSSPTIRGLSQFDISSSIANVSTVVNGIYIPRNYSVDLGIADVNQVEIIKGPQSALYGGNAFAGVISYTLAPTTAQPHADVSLTAGNAGRFDVKLDASGSLFDGKLQLRGYGSFSDYDGTWKNNYPIASGSNQDVGGHDNRTYGFAAKFAPTTQIEADVNYFHLDRHEDVKPGYTADSGDSESKLNCGVNDELLCGTVSRNPLAYASASSTRPPGILYPFQPGFTSSTDFLSAQLKAQITSNFDITYLFGHVRSFATEITSQAVNPVNGYELNYAVAIFGAPGAFFGPFTPDQKEGGVSELNSHELRFDYSLGHFKALFGLYYAGYKDSYEFNIWETPDGQAISGEPSHPFDFAAFPFALEGHEESTYTTAQFGRLSYSFLDDKATVGVEVRHSSDYINYEDIIAHLNQKTTFDTTTPRFTADYKLTPNTLIYASAAEGEKDGGFNGIIAGSVTLLTSQQTFQPETNWTYELGTKNVLFGGKAIVNADVFLVKWDNLQIQEQPLNTPAALAGTTSVITTNLGAATSYGLETDGLFKPIPHLDLNYALALIHPTFDSGVRSARFANYCDNIVCPTNASVAGNTLPRTSKFQLTGGSTWTDTIMDKYQWNVHGEFTYQSQQEVEEMNLAQIPSRILFNASAGIKGQYWDLTFWGKNILNKKYVADSLFVLAGAGSYTVSYGELATYGATLNFHY